MTGHRDIVNGGGHIVATLTIKPSAKEKPILHQTCVVTKQGRTLHLKFLGTGFVGSLTFREDGPQLGGGSHGPHPMLTPKM